MFTQLNTSLHRQLLEERLEHNRHLVYGAILDVGSGSRRYDRLFTGTIIAVDIQPNEEKDIIFADVGKHLPFPDNSFDAVVCLEVLEYVASTDRAIQELHRVLKPGGTAIVSLPFLYHDHDDVVRYTKNGILSYFDKFEHTNCTPFGSAFTVMWDIVRKKTLNSQRPLWHYIGLPLLVITHYVIQHSPIKSWSDRFYSGIFIVARK